MRGDGRGNEIVALEAHQRNAGGSLALEKILVTNDEKEVMKGPNIPTLLRRASPGADLPEVLPLNLLGGANATICGMVAIGGAAVAMDLSGVDKR